MRSLIIVRPSPASNASVLRHRHPPAITLLAHPMRIQIAAVGRPGRRLTIVKCGRPPGLLTHDWTTKHRNRTSDIAVFLPEYRNIGHRSFYPNRPFSTRHLPKPTGVRFW